MSATPSAAELAAIRWLNDNWEFSSRTAEREMRAYYSGRGHVTGHASAGRRGAAGRMVGRLREGGWLDKDGLTDAGRAVAEENRG